MLSLHNQTCLSPSRWLLSSHLQTQLEITCMAVCNKTKCCAFEPCTTVEQWHLVSLLLSLKKAVYIVHSEFIIFHVDFVHQWHMHQLLYCKKKKSNLRIKLQTENLLVRSLLWQNHFLLLWFSAHCHLLGNWPYYGKSVEEQRSTYMYWSYNFFHPPVGKKK